MTRTMFLAFTVKKSAKPEERQMQIRRIAVRYQRTASASTHVYIRFSGGIPDAVALFFHNNVPTQNRCAYRPAIGWIMETRRYEILDTTRSEA